MPEKEIELPTPFGLVHLPKIKIPKLKPPEMDERRGKAMAQAIAIDLSSIVAIVPVIGDIISDVVEDTHFSELRKILTKPELEEYLKQDRVAPSTVAIMRTFMEEG